MGHILGEVRRESTSEQVAEVFSRSKMKARTVVVGDGEGEEPDM